MRRRLAFSGIIAALVGCAGAALSSEAVDPDDSLRIYAVNVVSPRSVFKYSSGFGIYLGRGLVITAAHVLGRWTFFGSTTVLLAGQVFPATLVKKGSFDKIDLALLSVEEARLPVGLRLRRNPLCQGFSRVGTDVIVAYPERTAHSRTVSPLLIPPLYRKKFDTLIADVEGSGSGAFDAGRKCLLGIMSASIIALNGQGGPGRVGYFVPAPVIRDFIPPELRL